jgi:hypothetical protein
MQKLLFSLILMGSLGASESLKNLEELQVSLNDVLAEVEAEEIEKTAAIAEEEAFTTPTKCHQVFRLEERP